MRIGLSYDLKGTLATAPDEPEDAQEEYDSPETVEAIAAVIEGLGHAVVRLGGGRQFLTRILREPVDFVFNIAEGLGNYRSREAQAPSLLEMLGIPYSGSDPLCLAISLDKPLTKKLVALAGVSTPGYRVVAERGEITRAGGDGLRFPLFVKPAYEGSSKGIRLSSRVDSPEQMEPAVVRVLEGYRQPVMVEEFIAGDEVTVGVIGNDPPKVLGIMRVLPKEKGRDFIYSLEIKRDWERLVEYECPARLPQPVLAKIAAFSLSAFQTLGCRDFARLDFRVSPEGVPYFLEINPLPGLNPHSSDLPIMARKLGWTYQELVAAVLKAALRRCGCASSDSHHLQ
jgi:D-alanine-D-alanine ligase